MKNALRCSWEGEPPRLGTALVLEHDALQERLWGDTLHIQPTDGFGEAEEPAVSARRLQIFLDLVGFLAADLSQFLLDDGFVGLLDPAEQMFVQALQELRRLTPPGGGAQEKVARLLDSFGAGSG